METDLHSVGVDSVHSFCPRGSKTHHLLQKVVHFREYTQSMATPPVKRLNFTSQYLVLSKTEGWKVKKNQGNLK